MTYTIRDSAKFGSGSEEITVNVMREVAASESKWTTAYNAVKGALESVNINTGITTGVWKIDTDAAITCDTSGTEQYDMANDWLNSENITWNEAFLWVVGGCDHNFIAQAFGLAWGEDSRAHGFVGDHIRSNDHNFGQSCIHESLHMYLAADSCGEIQNQILNNDGHSGNSKDHALGKVWSGTVPKTSPMLGFYGRDTAEHGDCDTWESPSGRSHTLATCTDRALKLSREHDNNNH